MNNQLWRNAHSRRRHRRYRISRHRRYLLSRSWRSGPFASAIQARLESGRSNAEMAWLMEEEYRRWYTRPRPCPEGELEWWGSANCWWPYSEDEWEPAPQTCWLFQVESLGPPVVVHEIHVLSHHFEEDPDLDCWREFGGQPGCQFLEGPSPKRVAVAGLRRENKVLTLAFATNRPAHDGIHSLLRGVLSQVDWNR